MVTSEALLELNLLVSAVLAVCLVLMMFGLARLGRRIDPPGTNAILASGFEKALRDLGDRLQGSQVEFGMSLRTWVEQGLRDGLSAAFRHVQEGSAAQSGELVRFGGSLKQDFESVRGEVASLSDRMGSAMAGVSQLLGDKLSAAEVAAAEGRTILLRDTGAAILQAREQIDRSMSVFGAEQQERLGRLDLTVKEAGDAVQGVLETFKALLIERVLLAGQATEASLKGFGEQQGQRLDGIARIVKEGAEASQAGLSELRKENAERLDAVREASSNLLERSAKTFADIKAAVVSSEEKTVTILNEQRIAVLERLAGGQLEVSQKLGTDLNGLAQKLAEGLEMFSIKLRTEQEQLRGLVGTRLDEMRAGNEGKLEEMRKAVDERLQGALEKQVGESFKRIAEQFAAVQQAIGQVQSVAGQVGDLRRLFSNVKSRGGWGEAQAEAMLQDMLPAGAYEKNERVREGTSEAVEFAIRIPGKNDAAKWIAVDSKFPTEDYERLLTANELGNREDEAAARAGLARRIRLEAERIGSKYIAAPNTVDFAVLYLPSDSLFAEVARSPGLVELVRRNHKIIVMGPSLLPAFLHTINVGYLTMAIERNATQIGETLGAVKSEWGNLLPWLDKLSSRTDTLKKGIEEVRKRAKAVGRTLKAVDAIDQPRAEALLGMDASAGYDLDDDEPSDESEEATGPLRQNTATTPNNIE